MENLKDQYKSICSTLRLLSDYRAIRSGIEDNLKKTFQMDCVYLLSVLAYQDNKLSEKDRAYINDFLGIDVSEESVKTFANIIGEFDIANVSKTIKTICTIEGDTWEKLGSDKEKTAMSVINFFEALGEDFLHHDNPKAPLEKLYRFIQIQKDYVRYSDSRRLMSDISRDFFGLDIPNDFKPEGSGVQAATADSAPVPPPEDATPEEPETDPMDDLNELVGLTEIKKDVADLISLVKVQKMREERGMKAVPVSLHLVFTGNPGTGKTTVARILARLYKKIGVLEGGQLVETDRSGLVAGYVGQTAIKTSEMIKQAMGGVLFIDEAYSLAKEGNDFGGEAISTILKAMEDNRDKFVVIVAGYDELMDQFINSNPGLKSRFSKYFHFPDYTAQEMLDIFKMNCRKYQYELTEDAEFMVKNMLIKLELEKDENFANARDVRKLFERVVTAQAGRLAEMENVEDSDVLLITQDDIIKAEEIK